MLEESNSRLKIAAAKIFIGITLPFLIEVLLYVTYTGLRTNKIDFSVFLIFAFLIIPIIFLYLLGPQIIFKISFIGMSIRSNLIKNFDELFLQPRSFKFKQEALPLNEMRIKLSKEERGFLKQRIEETLIPSVIEEAKKEYAVKYIDGSQKSRKERMVVYNEILFLFSLISSILLFLNFILVLIVHKTSISLDFIYIDQISNIVNVIIFSIIFVILFIFTLFLLISSIKKLRYLIPATVPIIFYEQEEEREKRLKKVLAIAEFPISNLFVYKTQRELEDIIEEAKKTLLLPHLIDIFSWHHRDQLAKAFTWNIYRQILEETALSENKKKLIEKQFKSDPFEDIVSSKILAADEEQAIKADLDYIRAQIIDWGSVRSEEQILAFLLIYRTIETTFRKIIFALSPQKSIDEFNFGMVIDYLRDKKLLEYNEHSFLNEVRYKRNVLFHEPGKKIDIGQKTMASLLELIQTVIERVQNRGLL